MKKATKIAILALGMLFLVVPGLHLWTTETTPTQYAVECLTLSMQEGGSFIREADMTLIITQASVDRGYFIDRKVYLPRKPPQAVPPNGMTGIPGIDFIVM